MILKFMNCFCIEIALSKQWFSELYVFPFFILMAKSIAEPRTLDLEQ